MNAVLFVDATIGSAENLFSSFIGHDILVNLVHVDSTAFVLLFSNCHIILKFHLFHKHLHVIISCYYSC